MGIGDIERQTQNRVVSLFRDQLGYRYLGNWGERGGQNVEEEILSEWLKEAQGYSDPLIKKAIFELNRLAADANKDLYYANKDVYSHLRYGIKVKEDIDTKKTTVKLIDWQNPHNNDFAIAEEVTVQGEHRKRPDVVLYVNGIALGVIELKRSTVSLSEGIRQNLDNQDEKFIKSFFNTMQLVMAGNDTGGLRYGTIETPEKYYLKWKESGVEKYLESNNFNLDVVEPQVFYGSLLDKHIIQLCNKKRLLEIIHDFTVFDKGTKKICRHNQYFGVNAAKRNIQRQEGGIIWHTQGSGKSLTMVWLAKWMLENISDARVLIITDRDELDKQIEKVFKGVEENIHRTQSGNDLIEKLNDASKRLLCSLVHKFGRKEEGNYDRYIDFDEIKSSLPSDFRAKGEFYVFVDECHRTQSGTLHEAMKSILPDALFIGFTGTPLLKKDKKTSLEVFGTYIHTYKFDEAVEDGVILDLLYEARKIEQDITSPEKIDQWFEAKTKGLTNYAKVKLKKRWGTLKNVLSSRSRLNKIVADVMLDMSSKDRLQSGNGNAMLVAGSIYEACKYYQMFQEAGLKKCAIVTSYDPRIGDITGESVQDEADTDKQFKYEVYTKMLDGKSTEEFEDEVKKRFVNEPAQMKLLIVVDKLLTGFDAPPATYLYIDKSMQDHGLFQAICRVNRLDGEDKPYGYIVDYKDLFSAIEDAVDDYTAGAFEDFDSGDVKGLLTNRIDKIKEKLETSLESIRALCEPVMPPKDTQDYIAYFCGDPENESDLKNAEEKRHKLYELTSKLVRAYAEIANDFESAGYTEKERQAILKEVKHYEDVRLEIKHASGDHIDLKQYEPAMRHLIDTYIGAEESETISAFEDLTLVELIVKNGVEDATGKLPKGIRSKKEAVAETIENNIRKLIIEEKPTNPKYFDSMSALLDQLIKERKREVEDYQAYLKKLEQLARSVKEPSMGGTYPKSINTKAKQALYDNLGEDEAVAVAMDAAIKYGRPDGWRDHNIKKKQVKRIIQENLPDGYDLDEIYKLVESQYEY